MEQNSTIKEQALHPEKSGKAIPASAKDSVVADQPSGRPDERITLAVQAALDKKALDPLILDLRAIASFTDFFIITSGTNARQVQAIADEVVERLKKAGTRAQRVEGLSTAEWVLVDYGDFIVHIFEDKARRFYDLERLWRDAQRVPVAEDPGGDSSSRSLRNEP